MELIETPIPHISVKLDQDLYNYCLSTWPDEYEETNHEGRYNVPVTDMRIVSELTVITKRAMTQLLPYIIKEYPKWKPNNIKIRFQYGGNIVSDTAYKMRDWHLDNGDKLIIGLWYFKHPDDTNDGGLHITNQVDEYYYPYETNRCLFIPNLTNAWHKVGDRNEWNYERRFINIIVDQDIFMHDYLRADDDTDNFTNVTNHML